MTVVYEKLLILVRAGLTNIEIAPYGFHPSLGSFHVLANSVLQNVG